MSTSSGKTWLRLLRVTVKLATFPGAPEIVKLDGYGEAAPPALMVIALGLHPVGQVPVIVTLKLQIPPPEAVQLTAVVPMGKNDPEAGEQTTGPQVPLVVGAG
jgi:hypothetical protein